MDTFNSPTFSSNFAEFNNLVKDLKTQQGVLRNHVNRVNDIDGKNESERLQLVSYQYQYLFFFIICILIGLFFFRVLTGGDTSKIDTIIMLIIILLFVHHIYGSYFS